MTEGYIHAQALLPVDEARALAARAAELGVTTPEWLGYLVLLSAYGALHPEVLAFQARADLGHGGTMR